MVSQPHAINSKPSPALYFTLSVVSACSSVVHSSAQILSSPLPPVVKHVVHLCAPTLYHLEAAHHIATIHVSASPAAVATSAVSAVDIAVMNSGATHHLWPSYATLISYHRVRHQSGPGY